MPAHRQKGADTHKRDKVTLPYLIWLCALKEKENWSVRKTVWWFVKDVGCDVLGGKNNKATAARLYRKIKFGKFGEPNPPRWLVGLRHPQLARDFRWYDVDVGYPDADTD